MQGVVRTFDPITSEGIVVSDSDRVESVLSADALAHSIFRNLRQGQRVVYELDGNGRAINVRIGSELDMGLPPDIQV